MVKRKLDSAVDESSVYQEICNSYAIVHNLWKIWRLVPSETGSYNKQAGGLADKIWAWFKILKACCRSK